MLDTLSLPASSATLQAVLRKSLLAWLDAFSKIAQSSGYSRRAARERAEQAVVSIEGALVLARVLDDAQPFERALQRLPELLVRKQK